MNKLVKILCLMAVVAVTFSSCKKKTTDTSLLEGAKWSLQTDNVTYSDSPGVSRSYLQIDTACPATSYTEFHDPMPNAVLKLAYTYTKTSCNPQSPVVNLFSWNIDPDNTVLYLYGNPTGDGSGGQWFNISSISSSQLVLQVISQGTIGYTQGGQPIYHTVTETWTYNTTNITI